MDQLICASLSHTHYWYEEGMLKAPADTQLVKKSLPTSYTVAKNRARPENTKHQKGVHLQFILGFEKLGGDISTNRCQRHAQHSSYEVSEGLKLG